MHHMSPGGTHALPVDSYFWVAICNFKVDLGYVMPDSVCAVTIREKLHSCVYRLWVSKGIIGRQRKL